MAFCLLGILTYFPEKLNMLIVHKPRSLQVKYMSRVEDYLPLSIPMDQAVNKAEVSAYQAKKAEVEAKGEKLPPDHQVVRPQVPLDGE